MKRNIAIILVLLALGVLGYWASTGAHVFTKTQVQVPVEDDLFETTSVEWKDEFHPGLVEYIGPISLVLLLGAGLLFWRDRKTGKAARTTV